MPPRFGRYWREEPNRWSRWLAARSTRSVVLVSVLLGCAVAALPWPHWWSRLLYGLIVGLMPYNAVTIAKNRLILWNKRWRPVKWWRLTIVIPTVYAIAGSTKVSSSPPSCLPMVAMDSALK